MLYPDTDNGDPQRARSFATQWIAGCLGKFHEAGHHLTAERMACLLEDCGASLTDVDTRLTDAAVRLQRGQVVGDIFTVLFWLAKEHPSLASWEHTISIYEVCAIRAKKPGCRSGLRKHIQQFKAVAHLWCAWSIRNYRDFAGSAELGYGIYDDFQCFLAEADLLRDFGQSWRHRRAKSEPPLPAEVWSIPTNWSPSNGSHWLNPDNILAISLPDDLIVHLKSAGRPRKTA